MQMHYSAHRYCKNSRFDFLYCLTVYVLQSRSVDVVEPEICILVADAAKPKAEAHVKIIIYRYNMLSKFNRTYTFDAQHILALILQGFCCHVFYLVLLSALVFSGHG